MVYNDFKTLFDNVVPIKQFATSLNVDQRKHFKRFFFSLNFSEWQLNLIWEFFWDDKTYDEISYVFSQKKLIKKDDSNEH